MKSPSHKSVIPPPHLFLPPQVLSPTALTLPAHCCPTWKKQRLCLSGWCKKVRETEEIWTAEKEEGGLSNLGFPQNDVSSLPVSSIKLTSVSQTFLSRFVCACMCVLQFYMTQMQLVCAAKVDMWGQWKLKKMKKNPPKTKKKENILERLWCLVTWHSKE